LFEPDPLRLILRHGRDAPRSRCMPSDALLIEWRSPSLSVLSMAKLHDRRRCRNKPLRSSAGKYSPASLGTWKAPEAQDRGPSRPSCRYAIEMERQCWYDCSLRQQALGSRAPFSPATSSWKGATQETHALRFGREKALKMAALKLRSFSRKNRTYSHSRSKTPKTSTSSISRSYHPRKSPRVPFGLKTSSAPIGSTQRPKRTTE
jgi:hypothetical protein